MPLSKRPGCSQTVSAPTLVVSGPSSASQRRECRRRRRRRCRAARCSRGSRRGSGTLPSVDDDDARVAQARELADGAVDDRACRRRACARRSPRPRSPAGSPESTVRAGALTARGASDGGRAGNRAELSRAINHHANSVPSSLVSGAAGSENAIPPAHTQGEKRRRDRVSALTETWRVSVLTVNGSRRGDATPNVNAGRVRRRIPSCRSTGTPSRTRDPRWGSRWRSTSCSRRRAWRCRR